MPSCIHKKGEEGLRGPWRSHHRSTEGTTDLSEWAGIKATHQLVTFDLRGQQQETNTEP